MVEITKKAHSIERIIHPSFHIGGKVVPYLFIENRDEDDLTLIDPAFLPQLPILETTANTILHSLPLKSFFISLTDLWY